MWYVLNKVREREKKPTNNLFKNDEFADTLFYNLFCENNKLVKIVETIYSTFFVRTAALKRNRFVMKKVTTATRDLVAKIMFKVSNLFQKFNQNKIIKIIKINKWMAETQSIHFNQEYAEKYQVWEWNL